LNARSFEMQFEALAASKSSRNRDLVRYAVSKSSRSGLNMSEHWHENPEFYIKYLKNVKFRVFVSMFSHIIHFGNAIASNCFSRLLAFTLSQKIPYTFFEIPFFISAYRFRFRGLKMRNSFSVPYSDILFHPITTVLNPRISSNKKSSWFFATFFWCGTACVRTPNAFKEKSFGHAIYVVELLNVLSWHISVTICKYTL
jgi:hypothetical protein